MVNKKELTTLECMVRVADVYKMIFNESMVKIRISLIRKFKKNKKEQWKRQFYVSVVGNKEGVKINYYDLIDINCITGKMESHNAQVKNSHTVGLT